MAVAIQAPRKHPIVVFCLVINTEHRLMKGNKTWLNIDLFILHPENYQTAMSQHESCVMVKTQNIILILSLFTL